MRICYLADAGSIHTQRWVKYFADKGHEVYLISSRPFGDNSVENVNLHVLERFTARIRIISFMLDLLSNIVQVRKLVRKIKPDILHAHYVTDYGFLGALGGFQPFILSAWGSDVLVAPWKSRISKLKVEFALRKAILTLTNSQYLKEYLHREFRLPERNVKMIPWGTDLGVFHKGYEAEVEELRSNLGIDESDFVILSPRSLRDNFRIESIVQAMPFIVSRYPSAMLILLKGPAQDSEYESKIDTLSGKLGVTHNIRVIRRELRPQEMAVLYNASHALISIPKSDLFAISIQEGMACGVVPVVGDLEVYHQYLSDGENALFVKSDDPDQIAEKIVYCIEHPELKEAFYRINRRIIEEKENWSKNAQKMEELYMSFLAQEQE